MSSAERRRLVNAAENMARSMGAAQSPERTTSSGVLTRAAVPLPIVEADDTVRSGRDIRSLGVEQFVDVSASAFRLGDFVARKMLPIPIQNRPCRRLTSLQRKEAFYYGIG